MNAAVLHALILEHELRANVTIVPGETPGIACVVRTSAEHADRVGGFLRDQNVPYERRETRGEDDVRFWILEQA